MKYINKILSLTLIFSLLILTSCQKEDVQEEFIESDDKATNTRMVTNYSNSMDMMCTLSRDCINPSFLGTCLILFPPQPIDPNFLAHEARGSAFVNQQGNLTFYLFSDLTIPEETKNTIQDFLISDNMIVPTEVADQLYGSSSPGQIVLNAGNYMAEVKDNYLTLTVPSNSVSVEIVVWHNASPNSEESAGFFHNKYIAELHYANGDFYNTLSSVEEINDKVMDDCVELCANNEFGSCEIPAPVIDGQSSQDMVYNIEGFNAYEKDFLVSFVSNVETINPFSNEGMGEALAVINAYEVSANTDNNIENKEAVLSFLAVAKYSAIYWKTQDIDIEEGDVAPAMSRFWWTVTCDAIGAAIGFFSFGPWGAAITGVANSIIGYLTYDYFFN